MAQQCMTLSQIYTGEYTFRGTVTTAVTGNSAALDDDVGRACQWNSLKDRKDLDAVMPDCSDSGHARLVWT